MGGYCPSDDSIPGSLGKRQCTHPRNVESVPSILWSGSYDGPNDGPLQAKLTKEGTIPDETFEMATCQNVDEAVEAALKIG